jgi:hypothetical protein
MTQPLEIAKLRDEVRRLEENYEFLLHFYRSRISEKREELDHLRRNISKSVKS